MSTISYSAFSETTDMYMVDGSYVLLKILTPSVSSCWNSQGIYESDG